jgi:iron complex outermembrane receptor protein
MSKRDRRHWCNYAKHSTITICGVAMLTMAGSLMARAPTTTVANRHQNARLKFALGAEPLAETLQAISEQSGRAVHFNAADVKDIQAPAIRGEFTAVGALQRAVAGSKVTMASDPGGGWTVFVPQSLDTVVVTAKLDEAETGFQATRSDTATRSGSDLMEIPQSITIITSDVMESQQATSVLDVLQDVSGVSVQPGAQGTPNVNMRGLPVTELSNGMSNPFATDTNVAGVERIEVLKGPQAILAGGDTLGGAVNIVTKKPSADPLADATLQDGTFGDKTATVDFSDALADDGKLSGRLIGSWSRAATSDAGYDGRRSNYLLPQVRWKDDSTDVVFGVSYDTEDTPLGRYTFALNGSIGPVPTMVLGNKNNGVETKTKAIFYNLEHKFTPWLTFVSRTQRTLVAQDLNLYTPYFPLDIPSMTLAYLPTNNTNRYGNSSSDNYLRFTFSTGPLEHVLSTGFNFNSFKSTTTNYTLPDFSVVQVNSDQQFNFPYLYRNVQTFTDDYQNQSKQYGLYAQDLITYGDLHALLNLRRNYYQIGPDDYNYPPYFSSQDPRTATYKTTPGLGLVYSVTPDVAVYGSYSQGFSPSFQTTPICGGGAAQALPLESRNAEIGVKTSTPDGLFSLTSSAFVLNEINVLQYNPALVCDQLIKGQRTRGLELDAQGQLAKGWKLIANYTYNLVSNTDDPGQLSPGQPRNHFSLWSVYSFPTGRLHGFGVGGGVTAYSSSYLGSSPGSLTEPGGARVDASAYYHLKKWDFTLGVKNVFNRTLYGFTVTPIYVPVETGRTAMFTVRYSFF